MTNGTKPLVVFTYAPAGLGHIRVADALISGIPQDVPFLEFAPSDKTTENTHRFTSLNVPARHVMEFFQRGSAEMLFTKAYVKFLKTHPDGLLKQFVSLVKSQQLRPEKIVIVATHFGLAYQLGAIKDQLEQELNTKINLIVQVTDDSPQIIWYVDSADLIMAPSHKTKDTLEKYATENHLKKVPIEVGPYPVDLNFAQKLSSQKLLERRWQYDPQSNSTINIAIPVSGAAVGMEFFLHLIAHLNKMSSRFAFHVICRKAPFTEKFIGRVSENESVKLYISSDYKAVVEMYHQVYMDNVIAAEVTKPSEQSFKALINNDSIGGSFLLLAEPVGRQEHDNINFLQRHFYLDDEHNRRRGYVLPHGSQACADTIWNLFNQGRMLKAFDNYKTTPNNSETGDNGVQVFWEKVCEFCQKEYISTL